jgi:hypothetical protein
MQLETHKTFSEEVSSECKGLILDESRDYAPVCVPQQKIPHLFLPSLHQTIPTEEIIAIPETWQSCKCLKSDVNSNDNSLNTNAHNSIHVLEYMDGVAASLYYYEGEWHLASMCKFFLLKFHQGVTMVHRGG